MGNYMRNAGQVRCMGNMRSITIALHGYLQDNKNVWPQGPAPETKGPWEEFWLAVLKPYGISERTWRCPTIGSLAASSDVPKGTRIHYMPTMFGPTPGLAMRWATHPWLIERADSHGQGPLICFPDGSIKPFNKVLAEQGMR